MKEHIQVLAKHCDGNGSRAHHGGNLADTQREQLYLQKAIMKTTSNRAGLRRDPDAGKADMNHAQKRSTDSVPVCTGTLPLHAGRR